jgi:hypothetical protein
MMRVVVYWFFCLLSIALMLVCWKAMTGPSRRFIDLAAEIFDEYGPALSASLIVLPVVMMDVLRMSNRFAGPVFRLRGALREIAEGRPVQPLNFRDDDFWGELGVEFNHAMARLARESNSRTQPTEEMIDLTPVA